LITGVELSQSSPGVIYVTSINSSGSGATLARSDDHGAHWTPWPMTIPDGTEPLIMGIDPEDANTVYLRVTNGGLSDSVVITTNGDRSFDTALTITGQFSSFPRARATAALPRRPWPGRSTSGAGRDRVHQPSRSALPLPRAATGTRAIFACGDMGSTVQRGLQRRRRTGRSAG
jgi:hypothetical protein